MRYFLSPDCALKPLEFPSVYNIKKDELYELDNEAFAFLKRCANDVGCEANNAEFIEYCLNENILTDKPARVKRPLEKPSPTPSLRYLELQITDKCNLRCGHCYIGEPEGNEIRADEIKTVLDEFEDMQGLRVLITGGEPLMHGEFKEINSLLPGYAFRKILFTNGTLLTEPLLKELNMEELQISIDGLKDSHESIRGRGSYERAMRAVGMALDSGLEVSVSTMVHAGNLPEFDGMERLFRSLCIKDWTVDVPCPSGRLAENIPLLLSPDVAGKYLGYGFGGGLHGGEGHGCGLHLMAVNADGTCSKCGFYSGRPVGRIGEGLRECWARIKPVDLGQLDCAKDGCDVISACRGGCRFRAESPFGKDLYRCAYHGKI